MSGIYSLIVLDVIFCAVICSYGSRRFNVSRAIAGVILVPLIVLSQPFGIGFVEPFNFRPSVIRRMIELWFGPLLPVQYAIKLLVAAYIYRRLRRSIGADYRF